LYVATILSTRLKDPLADRAPKEKPSAEALDMDSDILHEEERHSLASLNCGPRNQESGV